MTEGTSAATPVAAAEDLRPKRGGLPRRPPPANLAEMAETMSRGAIAVACGTTTKIVDRWLADTGLKAKRFPVLTIGTQTMPTLPADFAQVAPTLCKRDLRRRYRAGPKTVERWLSEAGVLPLFLTASEKALRRPRRPVPRDFRANCSMRTRVQLARMYGASAALVDRWVAETGLRPAPTVQRAWQMNRTPSIVTVDGSVAAQAAHHLRRNGCSNVFKAEILGRGELAKLGLERGTGFYIVAGKGAVPANDLIAMAQAKGFDPQAWARI